MSAFFCFNKGHLCRVRRGTGTYNDSKFEAVKTHSLGVLIRETECLPVYKLFCLTPRGAGVAIRPRDCNSRGAHIDWEVVQGLVDQGAVAAAVEQVNASVLADDVWWKGHMSRETTPWLNVKPCLMDGWCDAIIDRFLDDVEGNLMDLFQGWCRNDFVVDWRCLSMIMTNMGPGDAAWVRKAMDGTIGFKDSTHLMWEIPVDYGGNMKVTHRHGRADNVAMGPESHKLSRTVWVDGGDCNHSGVYVVPFLNEMMRFEDMGYKAVCHPGGNALCHFEVYHHNRITMMLPKADAHGYYFRMRPEGKLPVMCRGKSSVGAAFAHSVSLEMHPITVDLLREICRILRHICSCYASDMRFATTYVRSGREWCDGILSRIPFVSPWRALAVVDEWHVYLLNVYIHLIANVTPSASGIEEIRAWIGSSRVGGLRDAYVTHTDSLIATGLHDDFCGDKNFFDLFRYHPGLREDCIEVHKAFDIEGIWKELPTCTIIDDLPVVVAIASPIPKKPEIDNRSWADMAEEDDFEEEARQWSSELGNLK